VEYPRHPPVYVVESPIVESQFSLWPRYDRVGTEAISAGQNPFLGRTAFYITDRVEEAAPAILTGTFERTEMITACEVRQNGGVLRTLRIFALRDYRGHQR